MEIAHLFLYLLYPCDVLHSLVLRIQHRIYIIVFRSLLLLLNFKLQKSNRIEYSIVTNSPSPICYPISQGCTELIYNIKTNFPSQLIYNMTPFFLMILTFGYVSANFLMPYSSMNYRRSNTFLFWEFCLRLQCCEFSLLFFYYYFFIVSGCFSFNRIHSRTLGSS